MKRAPIPFNIRILNLTPDRLKAIKPVTSLDIFDQTKTNFHEEGLYSVSIFGRSGDPLRSKRFSYIDVKLPIFHPNVYRALVRVKALYGEIIEGSSYAVWDTETQDFIRSNQTEGETGYHFFLKYWDRIQFTKNDSVTRLEAIALLEKYKSTALTRYVVVLPAGLRDVEYQGERVVEDSINDYYRRLLSIANTITDNAIKTNPVILNRSRVSLQRTFNELYDYLESMLEGKKKFLQGKWATRRVFNATRNVITAMPNTISHLSKENNDFNKTIVGLFQAMKAALPVTKYCIRNGYLSKVFSSASAPAKLVNKKTLKMEEINLSPKYYDGFMSDEGLDSLLNLYGEESMRHRPVEVDGHYLALIYKGPDGSFKIFSDIDELPEGRNRDDVSPITFAELLYCSVYKEIEKYPAFITRYPITGMGSIYPSKIKLQVTVAEEVRKELADDWTQADDDHIAKSFPVKGSAFINAFSPAYSSLAGLGADFDGDTCSFTMVLTQEAVEEIDTYLVSKKAYVDTNGRFITSEATELNDLVFFNLTRKQPS